jgi:predicted phosphohydrolase
MTLQYASDLHIEFPSNKEFLKRNPLKPVGKILVLAGDIVPFHVLERHQDFFSFISDNFEITYWLPGNHEYYYFDVSKQCGTFHEKIRDNVFLVNNTSVVHDGVNLIFSTLWSKISPSHQWEIERGMNDFHLIKYKGKRFSAEPYNQLHLESLAFIQEAIQPKEEQIVAVFTHHCPTLLNYPPQYKGSLLNDAFAVELFDMIESSDIDSWVYGHHHSNIPEFDIGNTKMRTNQLGYVQLGEHSLFERDKVIVF